MKDWIGYLEEYMNSDLWGFILLDYYRKKKANGYKENPSHFIDGVLSELPKAEIDPVAFHNVLLSVCVHLLGDDFSDIMKKSINLLKDLRNSLSEEQLQSILLHYGVYGKREVFMARLKWHGFGVPEIYTKSEKAKGEETKSSTSSNGRRETNLIFLFYSYSHEDEEFRKKLEKHLSLLRREELINDWHDRKILSGSEIDKKIDDNIKKAEIILLLVSADFIASDYCYGKEMKYALQKHEKGEAKVIPIILRECDWESALFRKLSALPKDGKAVTSSKWKSQDEAFTDVAKGIRRVVEELTSRKKDHP